MNEQKNLFLAIGLSILIIVAFQFLFPQQTMMPTSSQQNEEGLQPSVSIDQVQQVDTSVVKTKEEILSLNSLNLD